MTQVNPLLQLSNQDLFRSQLALAIACGRSKSSLRKKHRVYLCGMFELLKLEADQRGQASPAPPFKA